MLTISLNPGFAILLAAVAMLASPGALRLPLMLAGALGSIVAAFAADFGDYDAFAQIGLVIVPLRLDALSQMFGLIVGGATALLALYGAPRRDRIEDVALLVFAGGAASAIYAGDLVSFAAAAALSAGGASALTMASRRAGAADAGFVLLAWHVAALALILAGVGLHWAETGAVRLERIGVDGFGGALLLLGVLVMAAAPIAHPWLVRAVEAASPTGAAALGALGGKLALYAAMRAFTGEPILVVIGAASAIAMLVLAAAAPRPRTALAYGALSQGGLALAAIGLGAPLAQASGVSLVFAQAFALLLAFMALGAAAGSDGADGPPAARARAMPLTAGFALLAGFSLLGGPGTLGYAATALWLDTAGRSGEWAVWMASLTAVAGAALHGGLRAPLAAFFGGGANDRGAEAGFEPLLAMLLCAFLILTIGAAPQWLYGLAPPGSVVHHPYEWSSVFAQAHLILFAALGWAVAALVAPQRGAARLMDLDDVYRGPLRLGVEAFGGALRRVHAGAARAQDWAWESVLRLAVRFADLFDRPGRSTAFPLALATSVCVGWALLSALSVGLR